MRNVLYCIINNSTLERLRHLDMQGPGKGGCGHEGVAHLSFSSRSEPVIVSGQETTT